MLFFVKIFKYPVKIKVDTNYIVYQQDNAAKYFAFYSALSSIAAKTQEKSMTVLRLKICN